MVSLESPHFCFASRSFIVLWTHSTMACPVGECGIPVLCMIPQVWKNTVVEWLTYAGPLSVFISFGMPRAAKAAQKCAWMWQPVLPAVAVAQVACEEVSMDTWTYFNLLNSGMWLTSACQIYREERPLGFMVVSGPVCHWQSGQVWTMSFAFPIGMANCLYNTFTAWWKNWCDKQAWDSVFGTGTYNAILASWSAQAFPLHPVKWCDS